MEMIKEFIENELKMEVIEHSFKEVEYLITPMFSIIKYNNNYAISFGIDINKKIAFEFYIEFGNYFVDEIHFEVYDDCLIKVNNFTGGLEYFCFGADAKRIYFNEIYNDYKLQSTIPKDVTFH